MSKLLGITLISDGYANLNNRIETDQSTFLYRVCLQQTNVDYIHYEIDLLQALRPLDFPTAYMIPTIEGYHFVETDHGKVMVYESGRVAGLDFASVNKEHYGEVSKKQVSGWRN